MGQESMEREEGPGGVVAVDNIYCGLIIDVQVYVLTDIQTIMGIV